ncbi:uncharacterized protein LOC113788923 [Dermatophagoides pteronyssinus]|uniref:Uncharacterized protein n=2 Tax=Dermatophagoides pteronyssinus TaxID=6956 RepID=A0ABQ8JJI9_DERPT|nr:uncharacterized protein LOC113788923 [Dermatophagoides pteronyssinus]KAH9422598.1 hypothetical protein DERP_003275 [Dermatophagoides pteronyssinus]
MLDILKKQVLSIMPTEYSITLVDKYWNNFAQIIITSPFIWFHFTSIMAYTDWNRFNCIYRCLFIFYLIMVFTAHELIRLIIVKILKKELTITDLLHIIKQILISSKQCIFEHPLTNCIIDKCKTLSTIKQGAVTSMISIDKQK